MPHSLSIRYPAMLFALATTTFALLLAGATSAPAAQRATIGSDLQGSPNPSFGWSCGLVAPVEPCVTQQLRIPGDLTRAPFTGTIRKWRFRTVVDSSEPYKLRLRVIRKKAPGRYRFVQRSRAGRVAEAGRHAFGARLRVRKGDYIGLQLPAGTDVYGFYVDSTGARSAEWYPAPANGEGGQPQVHSTDIEFLFNATMVRR